VDRDVGTWTNAEIAQDWEDLPPEDCAVKKREVSRAVDHLLLVQISRQRNAKGMGGRGLAGRRDIVIPALNGQ
jgi:hypothetical protein